MGRVAARLAGLDNRDDVVQDALLQAWRSRRQYDPTRGTLAAWLLAITAHQATKVRRRLGRRVAEASDHRAVGMPPAPLWFDGRNAIAKLFDALPIGWNGELRVSATAANRQAAMATYIRPHGGSAFELAGLTVLRIEEGRIVELTNFAPDLLRGFGLPQRAD